MNGDANSFSSGNARYDAEYYDNIGLNNSVEDYDETGSALSSIWTVVIAVAMVFVGLALLA